MLDWTDRYCRNFHRLLTRRTRLYTEMVTTGALLHGPRARLLDFDPVEHPLALQLGGSDPADLAQAAQLGAQWGYDEINLNCGCPSERVQRGAFGACLMAEPALVADGVKAMRDAVGIPVTVKHRIGLGRDEGYAMVRDFVGVVAEAGCEVFIVHARNAWLDGLSPKENRDVPPLRYDVVYQLKRDFPDLTIVLNGGVQSDDEIAHHLTQVDGVMLGRQAYHHPWQMRAWDARFFGDQEQMLDRDGVEEAMVNAMVMATRHQQVHWSAVARHFLGLRHGEPGARAWRRAWSDHHLKHQSPVQVQRIAKASRLAAGRNALDASEHPMLEADPIA